MAAYLISFLPLFLSRRFINADRTSLLWLRYLYISILFLGTKLLFSVLILFFWVQSFYALFILIWDAFFFRLFVFVFILFEHPWQPHTIDVVADEQGRGLLQYWRRAEPVNNVSKRRSRDREHHRRETHLHWNIDFRGSRVRISIYKHSGRSSIDRHWRREEEHRITSMTNHSERDRTVEQEQQCLCIYSKLSSSGYL